jgi:hypothetical protein
MAILKIKRLIEDLENDSHQVLANHVAKATSAGNTGTASLASSASYAGTAVKATSSGYAGTSMKATSAANTGTARVAHFASSGTANIAGTSSVWSTGGL